MNCSALSDSKQIDTHAFVIDVNAYLVTFALKHVNKILESLSNADDTVIDVNKCAPLLIIHQSIADTSKAN